jgi:hypothetical protein
MSKFVLALTIEQVDLKDGRIHVLAILDSVEKAKELAELDISDRFEDVMENIPGQDYLEWPEDFEKSIESGQEFMESVIDDMVCYQITKID